MPQGLRLTAATGLHKGDRDYQQDQLALLTHPRTPGCLLAVVADGMGGRSGGRKASDQVMLTARQLFERFTPTHDEPADLMRQLVRESHMVIRLTAISAEQEPHSTIAAFLVMPDRSCHWVHAGDSRVYHFRGRSLQARTRDHSWVQALVDRGELSEEEALNHPQSNILVSCLGSPEDPPADLHRIEELVPGDTLLACSDGLWHYFSTQELAAALDSLPPREAAHFLVDKARARAGGTGDNLSLVIVKVGRIED
ncbi:PP2C family protein-serine/threonine phosphatase [Ramlibacter sp. MAHUQ-53]|uniref:PP2C family protein-serine/threonine phosphatase n=1 Tax=unclassified Ramlibacter TaxID=2617605 RepID=UPI003643E9F1